MFFKIIDSHKLNIIHLHMFDLKAYTLRQYITKKNQLDIHIYIKFLIKYNSINIYQI